MKILRERHDNTLFSERIALETLIPALKESDDERMRNGIIQYLEKSQFGEEHYQIDDDVVRNYIAWLEKQGDTYTKKDVDDAWLKGICDAKRELEKQGKKPYWKPSEEQLQTLHAQLNEGAVTYPEDKRILFTLYEDLMKIMTQEEKQGEQKQKEYSLEELELK